MGKLYLILLFAGICLTLYLRIVVEATTYTSPDSHFYIRVANNLKNGEGLKVPVSYPFDKSTPEAYLAIWPAGYPLLIASVSFLTLTSSLVASKVVNIIFLALIFLLLFSWVKEYAWFPALYFCSFGMLEVFSYTWTEGPFLFFVLYLCFLISGSLNEKAGSYFFLKLAGCLIMLFLLRYAGIVYFFFAGGFLLYFFYVRKFQLSVQYFLALLFSSIFVIGYFLINYSKTGYLTGGDRFIDKTAYFIFLTQLLQGLLNEIFIIRNYYFSGYSDYLFLILLLIQLVLMYYLFKNRKLLKGSFFFQSHLFQVVIKAGLFYLPCIILLSFLLYFDRFNYRLLAPFSMPFFLGLLLMITRPVNRAFFNKTYKLITAFFLLSLVMNFPKQFILEFFQSLW